MKNSLFCLLLSVLALKSRGKMLDCLRTKWNFLKRKWDQLLIIDLITYKKYSLTCVFLSFIHEWQQKISKNFGTSELVARGHWAICILSVELLHHDFNRYLSNALNQNWCRCEAGFGSAPRLVRRSMSDIRRNS